MITFQKTDEQNLVLNELGNCIVVANPGSGKTFVISQKIRQLLPTLPAYKGVIAISYTNKASDELERRSLANGLDGKSSFFGTIDKFLLAEIVLPFVQHIWHPADREIEIRELGEFDQQRGIGDALETQDYEKNLPFLRYYQRLYDNGEIILESLGFLGLYVLATSPACRRYLRARYTHIFVDEYQDCDAWQHTLFIKLVELGLCGIAVGDPSQSIFAFANKNAKYLTALTQDDKTFNVYSLTKNHRCHPSISSYATRLLSDTFVPPEDTKDSIMGIHEKWVDGTESDIGAWISIAIEPYERQLGIAQRNQIAVLVKNWRTGNLVHQSISIPHKAIVATPLDTDPSQWGSLFRKILTWLFDPTFTRRELVEIYFDFELQPTAVRPVTKLLSELEDVAASDPQMLLAFMDVFLDIAHKIFPNRVNRRAQSNLEKTLTNMTFLNSLILTLPNEIQVMTLHKAKGLEFDLVFHLDMYQWILPNLYSDYTQELNLHYVGITRAKKCCVLCGSTFRHKSDGKIVEVEESEFLARHDLYRWRLSPLI